MKNIIIKYYLTQDVVLVKSIIKGNLIDCWFENNSIQEHRCLDLIDFQLLKS